MRNLAELGTINGLRSSDLSPPAVTERFIAESLSDGASESSINRRARNREQLRQVADRVFSGSVHAEKLLLLLVRELWPFASQLPLCARDGHAFSCPQSNQISLKFSKGRQDIEEHLSHGIGWVVAAVPNRQYDSSLYKCVRDRACIWDRPCQAVEFGNDQGVASTHCSQRLIKARPQPIGTSKPMIEVDSVGHDAKLYERSALSGKVLLIR
jgi:hypothetical protein